MERKLSTILALDVVGFSKLMATDEDMTLAILRQRRELIDQIIIASLGDSVDFGDCTSCAQSAGGSNGHGGLALTS